MFNSILAVAAAGACAAVIVGYSPEPTSAVAAGSITAGAQASASIDKPVIVAPAPDADGRVGACAHPWPYYEQPCLHDSRQQNGKTRVVRTIAIDRLPAGRILQAQR